MVTLLQVLIHYSFTSTNKKTSKINRSLFYCLKSCNIYNQNFYAADYAAKAIVQYAVHLFCLSSF